MNANDKEFSRLLDVVTKQAKNGCAISQNCMGEICQKLGLFSDSMDWYTKSARQGNVDAQFNLGKAYRLGNEVYPVDYAESIMWYTKAAKQGHQDAQIELGIMYSEVVGVDRNLAHAYKWHTLASKQGSNIAMKLLEFLRKKMAEEEIEEGEKLLIAYQSSPQLLTGGEVA